ncbi:MAG: DNA polymerase III subunit delta [Tissierellia bacterium]|nr:DNA polymerase III subunit delta [Tissierellia bacterium]
MSFLKKIEKKMVRGYYLFQGQEVFLADNTLERLIDAYVEEPYRDFNLTYIEGDKHSFSEIEEMLAQLPFMSDIKVVVIKNFAKEHGKEFGKRIIDLMDRDEHLICVLYHCPETLGKNYGLVKKLSERKRVISFDSVTDKQLEGWVEKKIYEGKKKIAEDAKVLFLEFINYSRDREFKSLYAVEGEIEKLLNIDKDTIELFDVENLTSKSVSTNIFRLTDAIGARKIKEALLQLQVLEELDEEPIRTLYMVSRLILLMYGAKSGKNRQVSSYEIQSSLGIGNYEWKKVEDYIQYYTLEELEKAILEVQNTDAILKSKKNDRHIELIRCISSVIIS